MICNATEVDGMAVDTVTRLRAGRPRNRDSITGRCNRFFSSLYEGCDTGHSTPSSVDAKNGEATLHSHINIHSG